MDPFRQQENDETYQKQCQKLEQANADNYEEINSEKEGEMCSTEVNKSTSKKTPLSPWSHNGKQQKIFDVLHKWSRD